MIFFDKAFITIIYDEEKSMLIQHWKGFATSAQFREGIEKSIEISKVKKPLRVLTNTKDFNVIKKEDTDWAANYGARVMLQYGMKAQALITPRNAFAQLSVKNYGNQTGGAYDLQFFDDVEKATEWLLQA